MSLSGFSEREDAQVGLAKAQKLGTNGVAWMLSTRIGSQEPFSELQVQNEGIRGLG